MRSCRDRGNALMGAAARGPANALSCRRSTCLPTPVTASSSCRWRRLCIGLCDLGAGACQGTHDLSNLVPVGERFAAAHVG